MSVSALSNPSLIVQTQNNDAIQDQISAQNAKQARETGVEYLELLLIQLQNQNPLEPTDTQELTNQLIQQSQLEQQIQTNEKLDKFIKQFEANNGFSSLGYIGQRVEVLDNLAPMQSGSAEWSYIVDGTPTVVDLVVTNAAGDILHKESGKLGVGPHNFTFNVEDSDLPIDDGEGVYLFINAQDSNGETLEGLVSAYAYVDGVDGSGEFDVLTAGGLTYNLSDILKITPKPSENP